MRGATTAHLRHKNKHDTISYDMHISREHRVLWVLLVDYSTRQAGSRKGDHSNLKGASTNKKRSMQCI